MPKRKAACQAGGALADLAVAKKTVDADAPANQCRQRGII